MSEIELRNVAKAYGSVPILDDISLVADNMSFALKLAGASKAEISKRVAEAAEILGDDLLLPLPIGIAVPQDTSIVYGVRPQHIYPDGNGFAAEVVLVEPTGDAQEVRMRLGVTDITMVLHEATPMRTGAQVNVGFDTRRWNWDHNQPHREFGVERGVAFSHPYLIASSQN
eukprot:gene6553-8116_t